MFRRAWWRAIPSELLVPVAMAAVLDVAIALVPYESGRGLLLLPSTRGREILLLLGLLELRRRMVGATSRLVVVAAVLQGAAAATFFVAWFAPIVVGRSLEVWIATSYVAAIIALLFVLAIITAARAWRSWLAPLAVVASVAWRMPPPLAVPWLETYLPDEMVRVYDLVTMLLAQLALLAIYRRLGAAAPVPDDLGRAERGARRVAVWLRVRVAIVLMQAIAIAVVPAVRNPAALLVGVSLISSVALVVALVWQTSGLVAMAGARVTALSPAALGVAAFAALWEGLLVNAIPFAKRGPVVHVFYVIVVTVGLVVAGRALRKLAVRRGAAQLSGAITVGIAMVVALQLLNVGVLAVVHPGRSTFFVLALVNVAVQLVAMLVLSIVYARVAKRMQVAATVDVF